MTGRNQILAIDAGTQSLRAMIFDLQGQLLAKAQVPFEAPLAPQSGWAEQDVESWWDALGRACHKLWANPDVDRTRIAGLSVTSQRASLINLDQDGKPLRPAILWLDQRRTEGIPPIGGGWGWLFRLAGLRHTVSHLQAKAQSNWIARHQPEIWDATAKLVLVSGYLNYQLTGKMIDATACQVAYLPFDYKKQCWAGTKDWKWRALGIRPDQLTQLAPPGEILGSVQTSGTQATGIPEGLPVIAAAADKACEVLGTGCLQTHQGHLSFGTAATFNITSAKYFETEAFIPPYPAGVPGQYSIEIQTFRGFWLVSWFLRHFGHLERQRGLESNLPPEAFLDELLQVTPPGCDGLLLQPTWSAGIKTPGPEARGGVIGFHEGHGRAHLYRAIIEGLLFALNASRERVERRGKLKIQQIRCSGGGSQSDGVMQIAADIFGLPTCRPHTCEASGLGAAMIAAVGLGLKANFKEAVATMTHPGEAFQPNPSAHQTYRDIYLKTYCKMYRRLKPLYLGMQNR